MYSLQLSNNVHEFFFYPGLSHSHVGLSFTSPSTVQQKSVMHKEMRLFNKCLPCLDNRVKAKGTVIKA